MDKEKYKEWKNGVKDVVTRCIDEDTLSFQEIGAILDLCSEASRRKIASLYEEYLIQAIGGGKE